MPPTIKRLVPPGKTTPPAATASAGKPAPVVKKLAAPANTGAKPTPVVSPRKGKGDGHSTSQLTQPIKAEDIKRGMTIIISDAPCRVASVGPPAVRGFEHLLVIDFREHPIKGDFTTAAHRGDIFHRAKSESVKQI